MTWTCLYPGCIAPVEHEGHTHPTDKRNEIQPRLEILLAPIIHYPEEKE